MNYKTFKFFKRVLVFCSFLLLCRLGLLGYEYIYIGEDSSGNIFLSDQPFRNQEDLIVEIRKMAPHQGKETVSPKIDTKKTPKKFSKISLPPEEPKMPLVEAQSDATASLNEGPRDVSVQQKYETIVLNRCSYEVEEDSGLNYYRISFSLKNNYSKEIKMIQGGIVFQDILGDDLYKILIGPDQILRSGVEEHHTGKYSVGFINRNLRMMRMNPKDVIAKLYLQKVVFSDNTVVEPPEVVPHESLSSDGSDKSASLVERATGQNHSVSSGETGDRFVSIRENNKVNIKLLTCSIVPFQRSGMEYYRVIYSLKNDYPKGTKLVKGLINFYDILGDEVLYIGIERDLKVGPGKTISLESSKSAAFHYRIKKLAPKDVFAELGVSKIVFEDNSVQDF